MRNCESARPLDISESSLHDSLKFSIFLLVGNEMNYTKFVQYNYSMVCSMY